MIKIIWNSLLWYSTTGGVFVLVESFSHMVQIDNLGATRHVPHVKQDILTLLERLIITSVLHFEGFVLHSRRRGRDCCYDNWNMVFVFCETDIQQRSINLRWRSYNVWRADFNSKLGTDISLYTSIIYQWNHSKNSGMCYIEMESSNETAEIIFFIIKFVLCHTNLHCQFLDMSLYEVDLILIGFIFFPNFDKDKLPRIPGLILYAKNS